MRNKLRYYKLLICTLLAILFCIGKPAIYAQELSTIHQLSLFQKDDSTDRVNVKKIIAKGIELRWSKPDSSLLLLKKAEVMSKRINYTNGIAKSLINMGVTCVSLGNYNQSFVYYKEAYPYCKLASNKSFLATLYIDIGTTYYYSGEYEKAAAIDYATLHYLKQNDTEGHNTVMVYSNLAALLIVQEQYQKALEYLRQAETIARNKHIPASLVYVLNNKGECYAKLNQPDKAFRALSEALQISRHENFKEEEQSQLSSLGELMLQLGQPRSAIGYLKQALQVSDATNPFFSTISPHYNLGIAYTQIKEYKLAEEALLIAIHKNIESGIRDKKMDPYEALASLYEITGRYKEALAQYHIYTKLKDSLLNKEKFETINQLEMKYSTSQKDKELTARQLLIKLQEDKLQRKNIWIAAIAGAILLLSVLFAVLFHGYRNKQRNQANRIHILQQQQEILQLKAIMQGEEQERMRIARELHDGIGGKLAAIQMHLSVEQHRNFSEPNTRINKIVSMVHETVHEVRKTSHNLMPDVLIRHGLTEALQLYCEDINAGEQLHIDLQIHNAIVQMERFVELYIYRIVQELVQNIIKHAQATEVSIQIRQLENMFIMMIEDNGAGFDARTIQEGMGLRSVRSRVDALQGFLSVESLPGNGTTVYIEFDLLKNKNNVVV